MTILLPILFAMVAFLYSMAGFGGASSYIALLIISGIPLYSVPIISLSCNLIVSGQGSWMLIKNGHARLKI